MNPPAFQFYADDFVAGVADMTQSEVGAYILLLCRQWMRGEIPQDAERAALIAKGQVSEHVMSKFPDGKNVRLEIERQKQDAWREKQRQNGIASGVARANHRSTTVQPSLNGGGNQTATKPEPNTNSPLSTLHSPITANTKRGHPDLADVVAFGQMRGLTAADCEHFWHHFESTGWIDKNGHEIAKWQSKLMTWKASGQAAKPSGRTPYVSELKTVLEAKKAQRQAIHNRGHEDALGWRAKTPEDAADHKRLNREISQLINQIAETKT